MSAIPDFPPYRDRYLPAMTRTQIAALPDKTWAPVLVATGAIEQHGPHLPVAVDALMGQIWLTQALARLPPGASAYVAPAITIGKSNEHTGFPGTLMISKTTLRHLLLAIARQVRAWGFRHLAVLNTHGGNRSVIGYTLDEIRQSLGLRATLLERRIDLGLSAQESTYGFHAGLVETAWMLAVASPLVSMAEAVCEYPAGIADPGQLRPEAAPATFSWATRDISRTGVMGDARSATVEQGRIWIDRLAQNYAEQIAELCREGQAPAPDSRHAPPPAAH